MLTIIEGHTAEIGAVTEGPSTTITTTTMEMEILFYGEGEAGVVLTAEPLRTREIKVTTTITNQRKGIDPRKIRSLICS